MHKKNIKKIREYYSKEEIVNNYDSRRFRGFGGRYIKKNEIESNLELLTKFIEPKQSINILDTGAGRGRLSSPLSNLGYKVYCLDSSLGMVKILRKRFHPSRIHYQSAFEPLKSPTKYDAITSLRFFDHFSI